MYYVIDGRVELQLRTHDGGTRPGWWLQAMAYAYASSAPPPPRAVPPNVRALVLVCQGPVSVPCGTRAPPHPPPPLVHVCIKRGDIYKLVDAARLKLEDYMVAAHAPQINIGSEPYVGWWAVIWRDVTRMVDSASVMVAVDTNSVAQPADRGTPGPDDTDYRAFLQAFNLRDPVDLHPVPAETYSYF